MTTETEPRVNTLSGIVGKGGSRPGNLATVQHASTVYDMGSQRFLCERCGKHWPSFQSLWSHSLWHDHPHREGLGGARAKRAELKSQTLDEHFEAIRALVQPALDEAKIEAARVDASLWKARALKAERQLATLRKLLGGNDA